MRMMKNVVMTFVGATVAACAAADIQLPPPAKDGGKPLMEVLAARKSSRAFADRELDAQTLSSLLWAANGISRPDGRRTAPTGLNVQDIDVYMLLKNGAYRYDARANALIEIAAGDFARRRDDSRSRRPRR